jgi:hypothetical protein
LCGDSPADYQMLAVEIVANANAYDENETKGKMQKCIGKILADANNMSKTEGKNKCDGTFLLLIIFSTMVDFAEILFSGLDK